MRSVILHFHLFKNAGTSLDATLKENFKGEEWLTKEFSPQPEQNRTELTNWILANPHTKCFSSHTAILQELPIEDTIIIPIIFVRHPIDRIASVYNFERKQVSDSYGATLARNTSMSGYIETRLSQPHDRQCRNFHTNRFATLITDKHATELERAVKSLKQLPFVGLVDKFSSSIDRLERLLHENGFMNIKLTALQKNVSQPTITRTLSEKVNYIKVQIGDALFTRLIELNQDDLEFYNKVVELYP